MNPKRIYAIFLRQFYLFRNTSSRFIVLLYWPTIDLFIWGILTVYLHNIGGSELNFITVLIGTVIFFNFFERVQYGVAVSVLEDVWVRNFVNIFATPLKIHEYISALIFTSLAQAGVSLVFLATAAWFLFKYNLLQFGLMLVPFMAVLFLFGIALGLISIAVIIRFGPSSEALIWAIPASLGPFSGVFYPISALPSAAQWFAEILPPTYVFEGMRQAITTGTFDMNGLLVAVLLSLIYIAGAYILLLRYYRLAIRKGIFARFLTEAF